MKEFHGAKHSFSNAAVCIHQLNPYCMITLVTDLINVYLYEDNYNFVLFIRFIMIKSNENC